MGQFWAQKGPGQAPRDHRAMQSTQKGRLLGALPSHDCNCFLRLATKNYFRPKNSAGWTRHMLECIICLHFVSVFKKITQSYLIFPPFSSKHVMS